eukprot:scaffold1458_cov377-Prasinococcus_capsulatus_cf.AAC.3
MAITNTILPLQRDYNLADHCIDPRTKATARCDSSSNLVRLKDLGLSWATCSNKRALSELDRRDQKHLKTPMAASWSY